MDLPVIWIISPDLDARRLIGLNLKKRGLGVLETSPQDRPESFNVEPQLIILDMDLPDESGWEAASALRRGPGVQATPIILLLSAAPTARRLVPLQPVRWLEKPLAMDALLALVWQGLGQQGT